MKPNSGAPHYYYPNRGSHPNNNNHHTTTAKSAPSNHPAEVRISVPPCEPPASKKKEDGAPRGPAAAPLVCVLVLEVIAAASVAVAVAWSPELVVLTLRRADALWYAPCIVGAVSVLCLVRLGRWLWLWNLLLFLSLLCLIAWASASTVCDPLIRTVWMQTDVSSSATDDSLRTMLLARASASYVFVSEPQSAIDMRMPAYSLLQNMLRVRLSDDTIRKPKGLSCTVHDTPAVLVGRHAVSAGAATFVLSFALIVGRLLYALFFYPRPSPPPPSSSSKTAASFLTLPPPPSSSAAAKPQSSVVDTKPRRGGIIMEAVAIVAVISALCMVIMDTTLWDWRPVYTLLAAFVGCAYLSAGLCSRLLPSRSSPNDDDGSLHAGLAHVWTALPAEVLRSVFAVFF